MNSTNGSPFPPGSPQAKLADRGWRWRNSWWIFAPIPCCGLFGFVGFLVAAIRTGKRHYWVSTAIYAILGLGTLTLFGLAGDEGTQRYDTITNIASVPLLVGLFAPIIHAAIKNKDYLTALAHKSQWYVQPQPPGAPQPHSSFMGISQGDYFDPQPHAPQDLGYQQPRTGMPTQATPAATTQPSWGTATPSHPAPEIGTGPWSGDSIDINRADASELVAALGIDRDLAGRVVSARSTHGRFENMDDLSGKTNLQPHHLIRFRNKVVFGAPNSGPQTPPTGPTGRILDF